MLTAVKVLSKINQIEERYESLRFQKVADVSAEMWETIDHHRQLPQGVDWTPAPPGTRWGGDWLTAWFRATLALPEECGGRKVFVRANTGGETLFLVDGQCSGVFDENHPVVMMTGSGTAGKEYVLGFEAYAGHSFPQCAPGDAPIVVDPKSRTFVGIELLLEREDVTRFVMDLKVLNNLMQALDQNSLRRNRIMGEFVKVFAAVPVMPGEVEESVWRPAIAEATKILEPLLATTNSATTPTVGIVGHSHIDTAWLWPLSETWRKCARTFSSVLNLMEQYPEWVFIQSGPCHTEKVKELYPEIFDRIKERVTEGRWEPNGAMWVEPDCNVPSGESFVRQLMIGQAATREWFGYTSDTLWLPDVFGYSGALPQILQGAGVRFFCTTKIGWSDTNRFPYDTFVWKGIDGTPIIANFHSIHCWPLPKTLVDRWNWVQHKDVQDRTLVAYGFGDGGGGPMAEMLEVAARVGDLEGCPRAPHTTVGAFNESIERDLKDLPEFSGELYLEAHRGTLTSIAKIKRGNRRSEFALRDAEFLATLAALSGRSYPQSEFLDLWKRLLTNQFHDILPGSSMVTVNDEAIAEFETIAAGAGAISSASVEAIAGSGSRTMLVNTLSWDRTEMMLAGIPEGKVISSGSCQWVETASGEKKLVVSGISLPALGGRVVDLQPEAASAQTFRSPFRVSDDTVETPFAVVGFDEAGRIVSLVDKATSRQVVACGGVLNGFETGEDIPKSWDNWNIDADQELKRKPDGRLVSRNVVADGPLQLRIRSEYRVGLSSTIVQDTVFHSDSPQIDFDTVIDWSDKHILLKAVFDIDLLADFTRSEIQYGHVERPTHRNLSQDRARFEAAHHKWIDMSENGFGVAILNDCKYGVSVHGRRIGLSLMKSGTHPDPRGDAGRHLVTYSLLPHRGFSVESVVRPAYELNVPVLASTAGETASDIASFVTVDAPNVIVESVKWAEDGQGFVVRLYEAARCGVVAEIGFGAGVKSVSECNLLEEDRKPIELSDGRAKFQFRAFEIKTLYCAV